MLSERNELASIEFERAKTQILAGNVALYQEIFKEQDIDEEGVEWIQPGTPEYDALLEDLSTSKRGGVS